MEYELAKQLKDAGFFQEGKGTRVAPPDKIVARRDDFAYVPTLEELIETCDPHFFMLIKQNSREWYAGDETNKLCGHGSTPIEAVARLWLALNTK